MKKAEIIWELQKLNNMLKMDSEELSEYKGLVLRDEAHVDSYKVMCASSTIHRILCENGVLPV